MIVGVGATAFGKQPEGGSVSLNVEAIWRALEDYGFYRKGQSADFVRGGALRVGRELTFNISVGQLSETGMPAMQLIHENVRQMHGNSANQGAWAKLGGQAAIFETVSLPSRTAPLRQQRDVVPAVAISYHVSFPSGRSRCYRRNVIADRVATAVIPPRKYAQPRKPTWCGHINYCWSRIGLDSVPMPEISTSIRSPSFMNNFGSRNSPTPLGVPVAMTSPGSSFVTIDR